MNNTKLIKIAPSILSANFAILGQEIQDLDKAKADYIHIDVMDGHFVPNITIGPSIIKSIRKYTTIPFDVHLMIAKVDEFVPMYAQAGADIITFHIEAVTHIDRTIKLIKSFGKRVGISLVPSTHESVLDYILDQIDLVLVMSVNPGFGGQSFLSSQLKKIESIKRKIDATGKDIELQVDGGINNITSKQVIDSGANVLVSGSYLFEAGAEQYLHRINQLKI
jgi:ribulose-phosphate 3-epimerase